MDNGGSIVKIDEGENYSKNKAKTLLKASKFEKAWRAMIPYVLKGYSTLC